MPRSLTVLLAVSLTACNFGTTAPTPAEHGHDHGAAHDHDGEHSHDAAHAHDEGHSHDAEHAPAMEGRLGAYVVAVAPAEGTLGLTLKDASGTASAPVDVLRVVLTGTGQEPQRLVLAKQGEAYQAPAATTGAAGYVAVVSAEIDGKTESTRITWGDVPEAHGHDHGDGHSHEH